jgi:hypothetical protein
MPILPLFLSSSMRPQKRPDGGGHMPGEAIDAGRAAGQFGQAGGRPLARDDVRNKR